MSDSEMARARGKLAAKTTKAAKTKGRRAKLEPLSSTEIEERERRIIERLTQERAHQVALAFLENKRMEEVRAYRLRGRRFENLDLDTINLRWAVLFGEFAEGDLSQLIEMDDLGAEMKLRGHAPPEDLVRDAIDVLARRISKVDLASAPELSDEIQAFLTDLARPRKN